MKTRLARQLSSLPKRATRALLSLAVVLISVVPGGCAGGTETGNPSFEAKLSYTAYSSRQSVVSVRESVSGATVVTAVWLILGDVRFERTSACEPEVPGNPRAPGLGVGNHASASPASTSFQAKADDYCGVDFAFVHTQGVVLPPEAPASLADNTIVIQGTSPRGTPFTLESDVQALVRLAHPDLGGTFVLSEAESKSLLVFDVGVWLETLDWTRATETAGAIRISRTDNAALYTAFERRLNAGVYVLRDDDGDGRVDAGAEVLATGAAE